MNWSTLRDDFIRVELKDTGGSEKWSDAELLAWAQMGMRDISKQMPITKQLALTPTSGTRSYVLTMTDRTGPILLVEHPDGIFLEKMNYKPGTSTWYPHAPAYLLKGYMEVGDGWWEMRVGDDDTLFLTQDPDTEYDITVHYSAQRNIPTLDASAIDLWDNDLEILEAFVCWRAYLRVGGQDASLSRWSEKSGKRDDNPLNPQARAWKQRYEDLLADREPLPFIRLYRRGRM